MTISRNLSILAEGANSSGVLGAAYGGTGLSTPGTSGNVLTSNGTGWVSSAPTGGGGGSGGGLSTSSVTLTSASGGAQAMAPTTYGQYFKLPDATTMSSAGAGLYNLSNTGGYYITIYDSASNIIGFIAPYSTVVVGLSSTSSATGNWILSNHELLAPTAVFNSSNLFSNNTPISWVILDSNRSLFVFAGPTNTYGLVYDQTAGFGSLTLLVASATIGVGLLIGTNKVLIAAASGTSFSAVVLSVSGTSITVNTVATSTLPNGPTGGSFYQIIAVGTTYVVNYRASGGSILYILGMTVSGTTVTIGTETATSCGSTSIAIFPFSSTVLLAMGGTSTTNYVLQVFSASGTTLSAGGTQTISSYGNVKVRTISSGTRYIIYYNDTANTTSYATLASITGTTINLSTVTFANNAVVGTAVDLITSGSKAVVFYGQYINVLTDTSGTLSQGTPVALGATSVGVGGISTTTTKALFLAYGTTYIVKYVIDFSGSSPVISEVENNVISSSSIPIGSIYPPNFYGLRGSALFTGSINITANSQAQTNPKYFRFNPGAQSSFLNSTLSQNGLPSTYQYNSSNYPTNENWWFFGGGFSGYGFLQRVQSIT